MKRSSKISSTEFDLAFDTAKDVSGALDTGKARRPLREQRRVNVDFPAWMIESLDREAGDSASLASQSSRCGLPSGSPLQQGRKTA